ncbi:PAS domain-containing protein [Roseisolibacter agri]|uniref:histidine kinase n=1 Tax=Roseisolibacter agri TaxID=2014610 RepID=A0AA37VAA1_9BACT|nr:PAS domain-containing protein [Roseisolibacter agri]GLC25228.1 hypothetical protein rosag_17410 [Roseisolibacter agri]
MSPAIPADAVAAPGPPAALSAAVVHAMPTAVVVVDAQGRVALANAAATALLGAGAGALPDAALRAAHARVAAGGAPETVQARGADGRWLQHRLVAIADGVAIFTTDVTVMPAGEALRAVGDGMWAWDVATGRVTLSAEWCALAGHAPGELGEDVEAWRAPIHPEDLPDALALLEEHLDGRTPHYESEHRMRRTDGRWAWVLDRGRVVARDGAGRPLRVVGTCTDVSARKLREAMLIERTRQLELAVRAGGLGTWKWDIASDVISFSASYSPVFGPRAAERVPHLEAFLGTIHPDDRAHVRGAIGDALAGRAEYDVTCRVLQADGSVRWLADRGDVIRDAAGAPVAMIGVARDVTEERVQADLMRASEARLRLALEAARMGTWEWDADARVASYSDTVGPLLGQPAGWTPSPDELLDLVPVDEQERVRTAMFELPAGGGPSVTEFRVSLREGGSRHLEAHAVARHDGGHTRVVGALSDVTDRVRLEEQLRQAQKMEAVGQLAGGVAHDFNNLLTVIGGNLSFVRADLPPDHAAQADLAEIARASDRARTLVRQLLAFSRKQVLSPRALDLNEVVRGAEKLLRRVIGEEIVLETALGRDVGIVLADAGQLDQVLLNLAVNARDAMLTAQHGHAGSGGTLTLETGTVTLDARTAPAWAPLAPGRYVRLIVRDTGHGMDQTTRAHAFEPFFTTKPVGAGTGLGLATVYGIVAQSGGTVRLDSAPGQGTTVTILLPEVEAMPREGDTGSWPVPTPGQQGIVLLVEDEAAVRATARRIMERHGYAVLEARHGADALMLWQTHGREVTAVVTDLRMPEMGGRELASVLREDRPDLPLVLVTGYADQPLVAHLGRGTAYVEKPFTGDALLAALRQVVSGEP